MKKLVLALCISGLLGTAGCNSKSENSPAAPPPPNDPLNNEYKVEPTSGVINSQPWVLLAGAAHVFAANESLFHLTFNDQEFADPCASESKSERRIQTEVTAALGEVILKSDSSPVNFAFRSGEASTILPTTQARIKIDKITEQEVTGSIIAYYDSANSVNGSFRAKLCVEKNSPWL